MTSRRKDLQTAREALDQLEAFAGLLGKLEPPKRTRNPGEPDMVEIRPGVWTKLASARARAPELVAQARAVLDFADELEQKAEQLGKELRACRKSR